jgi:hypothetical protein
MESSILTAIKKLLGIDKDYTHFDQDIMIQINSAFMRLNQLGVGPLTGFVIVDANNKWSEFMTEGVMLESVKSYIYLKTRLVFDPPQSSFLLEAIKEQIKELEWTLNVQSVGVN